MDIHAKVASLVALLTLSGAAPALAQQSLPVAQTPAPEAPPPPDGQIAEPTPEPEPAPASDPDEEAEIAAELARIQAQQAAEPSVAPTTPATGGSASSRGLSNTMNPALSVSGLPVAGGTTRRRSERNEGWGELASGISIMEVELIASAIVDPYFRADVSIAGSGEEMEFEDVLLTTLEIPRVTFRIGQTRAAFGRHALLHVHAFPFITAPQPWRALLGDEGLADPGVSADILLPLPFYAELNAQAFAGEWRPMEGGVQDDPETPFDETEPDRRRDADLAYVGHLKTLFELTDSATLEVGGTYVGGRNGWGGWSHIAGADLTLKWRPVEAERYRGLDWTSELLWVKRGDAPGGQQEASGGGYSSLRVQFAQRFWVQARGSILGVPQGDEPRVVRGEALFAFVPSEFSALRLQYAVEKTPGDRFVQEVFTQAIFSIGPHPSHSY